MKANGVTLSNMGEEPNSIITVTFSSVITEKALRMGSGNTYGQTRDALKELS